jgi:subtilisin family serine protease
MNKILPLLYFIIFSVISVSAQQFTPQFISELENSNQMDCILTFNQPDLVNSIPANLTKEQKGTLVFQILKENLDKNAAGVVSFLTSNKVDFSMNYVTSSILIYHISSDLLVRLTSNTSIKRFSHNPGMSLHLPSQSGALEPRMDYTWGLHLIGVDSVHAMGVTGTGAVVAGNDTGFDWTHPAIMEKYRGWSSDTVIHSYNWHDGIHENSPLSDTSSANPCGLNLPYPCDDNSHGTHTMGTMVGTAGDSIAIGMAPGAKWIATRNMERGNGSLESYLECLQWYLAPTDINNQNPDPTKSPDVINNSWYCSESEGCNVSNWALMFQAVDNLNAAGIMVVIAAGNSGPGCETISYSPNMAENGFIVGAIASNDTISRFSSRGLVTADSSFRQKPDVVAPGSWVYSCIPGNKYTFSSGTSMASPHVSGLVALIVSANPLLRGKVDTIKAIIKRTAVHKFTDQECTGIAGTDYPNPVYGYGRIDALAAVKEALKWRPLKNKRSQSLEFTVFPNPTSGELNIQLYNPAKDVTVEILNLYGQIEYSRQFNNNSTLFTIQNPNLTNGMKIVRVSADGRQNVYKVMVIK